MRESWTDDRLDYLNRRVEEGFARVDERFKHVDERFDQMDKRFDRLEDRFERMDDRVSQHLLATQRLIIQVGGGMIATLIVGVLAVLATHL